MDGDIRRSDLERLTVDQLRQLHRDMNLKGVHTSKKGFVSSIHSEFRRLSRIAHTPTPSKKVSFSKTKIIIPSTRIVLSKDIDGYKIIKRLGVKGKEGTTYLVRKEGKDYAMKRFASTKSIKTLKTEIELHHLVHSHRPKVTPTLYDYDLNNKYIVMEVLDKTLYDILQEQGGQLTLSQQMNLIEIFQQLDKIGVFQMDPGILNFMTSRGSNRIYIIDYGMAKLVDERVKYKYGPTPNMKYMPLGLILKIREIYPQAKLEHLCMYIK